MAQSRNTPFTFVEFDINARGVSNVARSHLMEARARTIRESQTQAQLGQHYSALPWRFSEGANSGSRQHGSRSAKSASPPTCEAKKNRRPAPSASKGTKSSQEAQSGYAKNGKSQETGPHLVEMSSPSEASHHDFAQHAESFTRPTRGLDGRGTSSDHVETLGVKGASIQLLPRELSAYPRAALLSTEEYALLQFFSTNAGSILGFQQYPDIVSTYNPIDTVFLPVSILTVKSGTYQGLTLAGFGSVGNSLMFKVLSSSIGIMHSQ